MWLRLSGTMMKPSRSKKETDRGSERSHRTHRSPRRVAATSGVESVEPGELSTSEPSSEELQADTPHNEPIRPQEQHVVLTPAQLQEVMEGKLKHMWKLMSRP